MFYIISQSFKSCQVRPIQSKQIYSTQQYVIEVIVTEYNAM